MENVKGGMSMEAIKARQVTLSKTYDPETSPGDHTPADQGGGTVELNLD